jgi:translocation and assembly module TamB
LLSSGDSVPVDQKLARAVGLDEVSLKGSGELQESVVAFGKRLSDRLYVSYEQGLGAVPSNLVKLDYSLSRRWSVRAETGTASGWGLFYRFSWD